LSHSFFFRLVGGRHRRSTDPTLSIGPAART
jgi:hypothetical protein